MEINELVERAQGGDADAFGQIYERLVDRVYRFVRVRTTNPADAEDVTQRVFMHVLEGLPRYEERGLPFNAWVFRIARNVLIDAARATRDTAPLEAALNAQAREPGPPELAEAADERAALIDAIGSLTGDQRDVLTCRFFAELSVAEVASLLGKRPGTVRTIQFRALAALRQRLASKASGHGSDAVVKGGGR